MKGIVLAGGSGTRLYPITKGISKQLLPVYDKPMIYYPISVLMLAGIRDILIISTLHDTPLFQRLLGNGEELGVHFSYATQAQPNGIAEAFIIGKEFIANDSVALILGDNIFYGQGFTGMLQSAAKRAEQEHLSTIFGYQVSNPQRFGVAEFDTEGRVIGIEEKPSTPKSNFAITGLYFYTSEVVNIAKSLTPSKRGELEITDVNNAFLHRNQLYMQQLGRGFSWLDTGTCKSLYEASTLVASIESRQGIQIACLEEIAWRQGWISSEQLRLLAEPIRGNEYGEYLIHLSNQ